LVVDLSRRGLFVQTGAVAKTGDDIEIVIRSWNSETAIVLNAQVMWRRKVPLRLRSVVEGGLGLQIRYAPEPYYVMLAEASQDSVSNRGRGV
jgi:Tfp pilus assembly protein PilZ